MLKRNRNTQLANNIQNIEKEDAFKKSVVVLPVSISAIVNPKKHDRKEYSEEGIQNLAENIKAVGLLSPVVVRKIGGNYERVFGFRRIEAAKYLGWKEMNAIVVDAKSDEASLMMLSENLMRVDPNPYDQVVMILEYLDLHFKIGQDELRENITNAVSLSEKSTTASKRDFKGKLIQILEKLGNMSLNALYRRMRVLDMNSLIIKELQAQTIKYLVAVELNKIKDVSVLKKVIEEVKEKELGLRDTVELVKELLQVKPVGENIDYVEAVSKIDLAQSIEKLSDAKKRKALKLMQQLHKLLEENR